MLIIPEINIITTVDVIGALSANTLDGNIYMMDNTRSPATTGQGTGALGSAVRPGQVINWHVWPIDVQTFVSIKDIKWAGNIPCDNLGAYGAPFLGPYWAGMVKLEPPANGRYDYQLELVIQRKTMTMTAGPYINVIRS